VLLEVVRWRDAVCRARDESVGYVLPRAQLTLLAQHMPGAAETPFALQLASCVDAAS
jgi:ribonuclease D